MTRPAPLRVSISVCLAGLLLSGCQESQTLSSGIAPATSPELPNEAPIASRGSEQVAGKPVPPIAISYEIRGEPQVGRPLEIRVTTRSQVALTDVSFEVSGDERVAVATSTGGRNVARVPRDEAMIRTVTVTPLLEGSLHVSVLVQADINGVTQARNFLIPIQVGVPVTRPRPADSVQVDGSGELIISLPAREIP